MNIKIHTYFYGNNYGALLQSLCLRNYLSNKFNANVEFDKYQPKKFLFREEFKPLVKKNLYHSFIQFKKFLKLRSWKKKYIHLKPTTYFKKITYKKNHLSFYGSDEIWNFNNPFFGFDPIFFGKDNENIKFSYAASFGSAASEDKINPDLFHKLKYYFHKFKFISVRDSKSQLFIKKNFNIDATIVLDPIFLIDNISEVVATTDNVKSINFEYCVLYGQYFNIEQINIIKNFSKRNKLKILSVGYYNKWADLNFLESTPSEFLYYLEFSKFVFTSMFHGVLLSVKLNKIFWFSEDPYRKNKLDYFINLLNLKNRTLNKKTIQNKFIDYNFINLKIQLQKKESENFLEKCINFKFKND